MRKMAVLCNLLFASMLLCACAAPAAPTAVPAAPVVPTATPVPTVAPPTVAPTAAPPPTDTPVPGVQIQDLVGWWNLSPTQFFIRFGADGRMAWLMSGAELGLNGFGGWDGPLSLEDGVVKLQSRPVTPGSLDTSCDRNAIARYRVQMASPDKLEWSLIEDPCVDRQAFFKDVAYTRAQPLEVLTGVWKAAPKDGATLTLRDNLFYQVTISEGGKATPLVRGAFYWDGQASQVMFLDDAIKPCGTMFAGAYKMAVEADGRLKLTSVLDPCEERRRALSEWGPYTRVDPPAWAGRYAAQGAERFLLDLSATGVYVLFDEDTEKPAPLHEGVLDAEGQQMRLLELNGTARCPRSPANYEFGLGGDTLTLTPTSDSCAERESFFASHPAWVRIKG